MLKNLAAWLFVPGKAKVPPFVWLALLIAVGYLLRAPSSPVPAPAEALTERIVVLTPTPGPTSIVAAPVETPTPVGSGGTVAFSMRHSGNSDIYLLSQADGELLRLTYDPDEDRDPAWSPDGRHIAFASRRSRGWDLYTIDVNTGTILRITRTPDFEGAPAWSPDARWLAYEGYVDGNLDIHIQNLESGESQRVTTDDAPDYSPAWSPNGRYVAFVSYRKQNKDLFVLSLDDGTVINLTNTPEQDEDFPAWSPSGEYLAYSAGVAGAETLWRIPFDLDAAARGELRPRLFGVGHKPTWGPDGDSMAFVFQQDARSYLIAADMRGWALAQEGYSSADAIDTPDWSNAVVTGAFATDLRARSQETEPPPFTELLLTQSVGNQSTYELVNLPDVNNSDAAERLSDRVNDSYNALRKRVEAETGWDYLGILGDSWRPMNHTPRPGQGRISWHVCGRAVDIDQGFLRKDNLELVKETVGGVTYWRVYIRTSAQDGTLGEPLRVAPWDLDARSKGGLATANGGEWKEEIPEGYYVDFTTIAMDYGWERRNALSNWRSSYFDIEWWHFQKTEGMSWYQCMIELYPEDEVIASYGSLPWWTKRPEWEVQQLW